MDEVQSVLGVICASYDSFFDTEKKLADCIMERKGDVVDMTVAELAQASGTSDASVSRFCRRCGFKGFHHLKMTLAREIGEAQGRPGTVSNDISRENIGQSLQNILANKVEEMKQTISMIDEKQFEEILSVIEHARMVQLAAVGNTIPVAMDGAFKLNQLGIPAVAGTIWDAQTAYTFNLGDEDVLIIISNSGSSKRLMAMAEGAKENGIRIIAITNNPESPIAKISDYQIVTATREKLLLGEFCFSRVSATTVIEILYLFLAVSKKDAYETIRRHEAVIREDKTEATIQRAGK